MSSISRNPCTLAGTLTLRVKQDRSRAAGLDVSVRVSVCVSVCVCVSFYVCMSVCLCACVRLCLSMSVCLSVCLSVCVFLSLPLPLSFSLPPSPSPSPFSLSLCGARSRSGREHPEVVHGPALQFSRPALRHGSLDFQFQVAKYLPRHLLFQTHKLLEGERTARSRTCSTFKVYGPAPQRRRNTWSRRRNTAPCRQKRVQWCKPYIA